MRTLGVIPARGGSKTIPRKNLCEVGGKPLLAWTIEHAKNTVHELVVSSDDDEILDCAVKYDCKVIKRPPRLAQDDTPSLPVVIHALDCMDLPPHFDAVILLQPTSPFRTAEDIRNAIKMLEVKSADSVVSMCDRPMFTAYRLRHANRVEEVPRLIVPNGAIYAVKTSVLARGDDWFSGEVFAYVMPKDRSLDIDTKLDLDIARFMMSKEAAA